MAVRAPLVTLARVRRWGTRAALLSFLLMAAVFSLTACDAGPSFVANELTLTSRDRGPEGTSITVDQGFTQAIYRYEDFNSVTVLLIDGTREAPQRVAELRLFWKARAGLTPIDRSATNTLVRILDFRDSAAEASTVGVYAGAGFMRFDDEPTLGNVVGTIWNADLRLTDRSETYTDTLGRVVLSGTFTAERDDAAVTTFLRDLNQHLEQRLGYPRLVDLKRLLTSS